MDRTRRARAGTVALCALMLLPSAARGEGDRAGALPNLIPLRGEVKLEAADDGTGTSAIRLDTVVANRGTGHLDLLGIPDQGSTEAATAYQCIAWAHDRVCEAREEVGDFVWHPEHQHHHFEGFAAYDLRRLDRRGRPDLRKKGLVAGGNKVSFCLIDYERDDDEGTFLEGTGLTGWPGYSTCVAGSGSQGISRGWRDVYSSSLEGQQIVVDEVPPGTYALVVTIDPDDRLRETDESDNVLAVKLDLGGPGLTLICVYSSDLRTCRSR